MWLVILTIVSKMKDLSGSQSVMYTVWYAGVVSFEANANTLTVDSRICVHIL